MVFLSALTTWVLVIAVQLSYHGVGSMSWGSAALGSGMLAVLAFTVAIGALPFAWAIRWNPSKYFERHRDQGPALIGVFSAVGTVYWFNAFARPVGEVAMFVAVMMLVTSSAIVVKIIDTLIRWSESRRT